MCGYYSEEYSVLLATKIFGVNKGLFRTLNYVVDLLTSVPLLLLWVYSERFWGKE